MGTAPFSARINLEQSRKQAKDLLKLFKAGDPKTLDHIRWTHPRFKGLTDAQIQKRKFALADAQLVVARSHYFDSWPKLLEHIETLRKRDPRVMRFEAAADAIIAGDVPTLRSTLREHPELVHERSTRAHHAPLLHFIAANGVENYRQISPKNAVEVAKVLLDAGAEVDAASDAYGGGSTALGLVATSTPPRLAGVQIPLMELLLERGASMKGNNPGDNIVNAALANGCPEAAWWLAKRGASVEDIIAAAGVGDLDLVRRLVPRAKKSERERALIMAAMSGHMPVLEYLLDQGVDVAAFDGMTALHQAAGRADVKMVKLLLARGAPLEQKNVYGGTVLSSTLWFAYNVAPEEFASRDYPAVFDVLIAAGAKTDVYPEMEADLERVYQRKGATRGAFAPGERVVE